MLENSEAAKKILLKKETVKAVRHEYSLGMQRMMRRFFILLLLAAVVAGSIYYYPRHKKVVSVDVSLEATNVILVAILNYREFHGEYPPAYARNVLGEPTVSWRVLVLPFFDDATKKKYKLDALHKEFDLQKKWDGEHNGRLVEKMPPFYLSPASEHKVKEGLTNFLTVRHEDSVFPGTRSVKEDEVTDLPSETVVVFEASDAQSVPWSSPRDFDYDPDFPAKATPDYTHLGGLACGKCSGTVSFEVEPQAAQKLMRKPQTMRQRDGSVVELTPRFFSPWLGFFLRNSDQRMEEENEEEVMRIRQEMIQQMEAPTFQKKRPEKKQESQEDAVMLERIKQSDFLRSSQGGYTPDEADAQNDPIEALKRKQTQERQRKADEEAVKAAAEGAVTGAAMDVTREAIMPRIGE